MAGTSGSNMLSAQFWATAVLTVSIWSGAEASTCSPNKVAVNGLCFYLLSPELMAFDEALLGCWAVRKLTAFYTAPASLAE